MKKCKFVISFLIFVFCSNTRSVGQSMGDLSLMQGLWIKKTVLESELEFMIIKGNKALSFAYMDNTSSEDMPLSIIYIGFTDVSTENLDSISIDALASKGQFYTWASEKAVKNMKWVKSPSFGSPMYFECDSNNISINGNQIVEYGRVDKLPEKAMNLLIAKSKIKNRNYIKEFALKQYY